MKIIFRPTEQLIPLSRLIPGSTFLDCKSAVGRSFFLVTSGPVEVQNYVLCVNLETGAARSYHNTYMVQPVELSPIEAKPQVLSTADITGTSS